MTQEPKLPERNFPPTRWTLVDRAGTVSGQDGFQALDELLRRYAPALQAHLVYMKRHPQDRAEDFVQSFIADKVLQGALLKKADRERGKFRTFLLASLERYVIDQIRKEQAARRSPGAAGHADIDDLADVIEAPAASSAAYDVAWARSIITEVLHRVRAECEQKKLAANWKIFDARVVQPLLHGAEVPSYEVLSRQLDVASPMQASNALITAKRIFSRKLKEVVLEYVGHEEEVEKEIVELRAVLAGISA